MRILLVNLPTREDRPPVNFPIGLGIIAQVLLDENHDVEVLDINGYRMKPDHAIERIVAARADLIGISGLISTYRYQNWLIKELKDRLPSTPILSGGGAASSVPELLLKQTDVDMVAIGEGEHTVVELAKAMENDWPIDNIPGLGFRTDNGIIRIDPRQNEPDLDLFPLPAYHLFPMDRYVRSQIWREELPSINVISSRGCPMDCRFCTNVFGSRSYRRRGASSVADELRLLKRDYGVAYIGFVDDNLTANKKHLRAVCNVLEEEELLWGCHGRVDTADDERLEMMVNSGCTWIGFGIESGSQPMLDRMNKRTRVEQAKESILRARKWGLFANTTFIMGYPGETHETILATMRFKIELNISIGYFLATPYPGTALYETAKELGKIDDEHEYLLSLDDAWGFSINLTGFSDEALKKLPTQACREEQLASLFQEPIVDSSLENKLLTTADEVLNEDTLLPELKGYILRALSKYYKANKEQKLATNCAKLAATYFGHTGNVPN